MLTKLKNIKEYQAKDITRASSEYIYSLVKKGLKTVAYSHGTYGVNGWVGQDENGNLYKITARNTNLFIVL